MKTRYYLRGLGLGILITAVFFLLGGKNDQTMSDEMIKQRAKELGMVESTVLANIGENTKETEESSSEEEAVLEAVADAVCCMRSCAPLSNDWRENIDEDYKNRKKKNEIINGVNVHRVFTIGRKTGALRRALNYFAYSISSPSFH